MSKIEQGGSESRTMEVIDARTGELVSEEAPPAEIPRVEDAPREPYKFFVQLHALAREKKISAENLKWVIKETYKRESSKDLTDSECIALIELIQAGALQ